MCLCRRSSRLHQTSYYNKWSGAWTPRTGTDPTNETSRFEAKIEMKDGVPVVTWEPDLNENGTKSERLYKVYGREGLGDGSPWQYPTTSLHRFFKVTVEMP